MMGRVEPENSVIDFITLKVGEAFHLWFDMMFTAVNYVDVRFLTTNTRVLFPAL